MSMPIIKPGTITREESVGNIIESISMEESGISHVLNAEAEKLNKVISNPNVTPQELININKSVKNTVDNVINLELSLKNKLNLFTDEICKIS
ncbi:MAG: hypothetical protein RSB41_02650 [Bacilli bacterium]